MKRKNHFNKHRICSSDNYEISRKVRLQFIIEQHYKNISIIEEIVTTLPKQAYARIFGKLIPISAEEVIKYEKVTTIIYK